MSLTLLGFLYLNQIHSFHLSFYLLDKFNLAVIRRHFDQLYRKFSLDLLGFFLFGLKKAGKREWFIRIRLLFCDLHITNSNPSLVLIVVMFIKYTLPVGLLEPLQLP